MTATHADELATTPGERACLDALRAASGEVDEPMERHCVRQFLIAQELAARARSDIDRELLLCAAFLHDAGIYGSASTGDVYVSDSRRLGERTLAPFAWTPERLARCLDAIEQHHAMRPRWHMGTEVELMRRADLVDVAPRLVRFGLPREWLRDLFVSVPRDGLYRTIGSLLVHMVRERPRSMLRITRPRGERTG